MNINTVIYGCGVIGQAIYQECIDKNIKIACFCDDSQIVKQRSQFDVEILTIDEIRKQYQEVEFLIAIPDAYGIISKLKSRGFNSWKLSYEILDNKKYENYHYSKEQKISIQEVESCILSHLHYRNKSSIFMRSIDVVLTEKCSLKCKDCSNLMQYYSQPKDYSFSTIINSLNMLFRYVDEIYELRILGGEPLINKDIYKILERIVSYPKIHRVLILTNGTIVPPKESWSILSHNKIEFIITDYGELSRNINTLEKKLIENNITYYIQKASGWISCSDIKKQNRNNQELIHLYNDCCAKNLVTLLDDKIFKCPYMANAMNLQAVVDNQEDYIDLVSLENLNFDESKSIIYHFLFQKNLFYTCDYCKGRSYSASEIEPAIQTKVPLTYETP